MREREVSVVDGMSEAGFEIATFFVKLGLNYD